MSYDLYMETCCRLADRFTEYICSSQNNFSGFSIAQHFDPLSNCLLEEFYVTGFIHCSNSNENRSYIENPIKFKLGALSFTRLDIKSVPFSLYIYIYSDI